MKIHTMPQYSPAWWGVRRGVPTASEFKRIIQPEKEGFSSQATGYAAELVGQMIDPNYGNDDDYVSDAMAAGAAMEPKARAWYEMVSGLPVKQVGFCTTNDGRFGCSPDALVGDDGVLELKSPTAKTHILYLLNGDLPPEYKPQVHGHLIVTGRKWCEFVSYYRGLEALRVRVTPNKFTDALRVCMDLFWEKYAEVKAAVPVTPIPFDVPEEAPRQTDDEAYAAMCGAVSRDVTVDPHN